MVGEKKLTKHFEYDMPSDIVMTFLSEVRKCVCVHNNNNNNKYIYYLVVKHRQKGTVIVFCYK